MAASTDSAINRLRFGGADFAPAASFELLLQAYEIARARGIPVRVGTVLTGDLFYTDDPDFWKLWARYGVLAAEMETAALYTIAAGFGVQALAILTASDSLVTGATRHHRGAPAGLHRHDGDRPGDGHRLNAGARPMLLGSGGTVVKAWEDTILIPTYERGPEDPNPPLLMGRRSPIHPGSA